MTKYIKGKDGKFQGSIGDGRDNTPSAAPASVTRTSDDAPSADLTSLAGRIKDYDTRSDFEKFHAELEDKKFFMLSDLMEEGVYHAEEADEHTAQEAFLFYHEQAAHNVSELYEGLVETGHYSAVAGEGLSEEELEDAKAEVVFDFVKSELTDIGEYEIAEAVQARKLFLEELSYLKKSDFSSEKELESILGELGAYDERGYQEHESGRLWVKVELQPRSETMTRVHFRVRTAWEVFSTEDYVHQDFEVSLWPNGWKK